MIRPVISLLLFIVLAFVENTAIAQEGNTWYFGEHAGVTFNTNPPSALFNSALSTQEGCASISDSIGQILFYTNGSFVYSKNHQTMSNGTGLMGHPSSSNSSIIVKQPGSDSLYFIFTVDAGENLYQNGYRYSVVDMSLNSGLGEVITKNVLLYARCSEKITAVRHANGIDVWIVTKDYIGNIFKVFKLGCNGVEPNPVISNIGFTNINTRVGALKASPDGTKIATVQWYNGWEIFDFDKATGQLLNAIFIPRPRSCLFGMEFSPDSKLLYISAECIASGNTTTNGGQVFQYKVDIHDSLTIVNSSFLVATSLIRMGDMQLGPDGKIYVPNETDSSLNVVNNPNQYGSSCNYVYKAINLGFGRQAMRCLPAFFKDNITSSAIDFSFSASPSCSTITFVGSTVLTQSLNWHWDFGDGNTATGQTVTHTYTSEGSFNIRLTVENHNICGARAAITKTVHINLSTPLAKFGSITQCGSKSVSFSDSSRIGFGTTASYLWHFGDGQTSTLRNPTHVYASFGQYIVSLRVTSMGVCRKTDSVATPINVSPMILNNISFGPDKVICTGSTLTLHAGPEFKKYYWQDGSMDSTLVVTQTGLYFVLAEDFCGHHYSDTVHITVNVPLGVNLGADSSICSNKPLVLNAGNGFSAYLWNTGNITQFQPVTISGEYSVIATNGFGCVSRDSITIPNIHPVPQVSLNKDSVLCLNQNNRLYAGAGFSSYLWQDGSTGNTIEVLTTGMIKVTVSNIYHCLSSDSVRITKIAIPASHFLPMDSIICKNETIVIRPLQTFANYSWQNGSADPEISVKAPGGSFWLKVIDHNNCKAIDTIKVFFQDCYIHIPNAFTPNNDGNNDVFKPLISGSIESYRFTIYNRFGQLIFSTTQPGKGWDGSIAGIGQNSGSFVWTCAYQFKNEPAVVKKGTVLMIR